MDHFVELLKNIPIASWMHHPMLGGGKRKSVLWVISFYGEPAESLAESAMGHWREWVICAKKELYVHAMQMLLQLQVIHILNEISDFPKWKNFRQSFQCPLNPFFSREQCLGTH